MSLKKKLGEELYKEVMEKVGEDTEIFIASENDGDYVPRKILNEERDKVKELQTELDKTKDQLGKTEEQIESLQNVSENKEELESKLEETKNELNEFKETAEQRMQEYKKKSELEKKLMASEANKDAIDLLVNDFDIDNLALTDEGLAGFDSQLAKVKDKRPGLFAEKQVVGDEPNDGETSEPNSWQAKYDRAIKNGNRKEAIKIKQQAFNDGYIIN